MGEIGGNQPIERYGKVLLVDDEPDLRQIVEQILSSNKLVVMTAENGRQALELLEQEKFDVVLCDVKMPEMTGIEFLEALCAKGNQTPVVFYSGFYEKEMLKKSMQLGAFDFLEKPISADKMLQVIDNAAEVGVLHRKIAFIRELKNYKLYDFIPDYEKRITQLRFLNYSSDNAIP